MKFNKYSLFLLVQIIFVLISCQKHDYENVFEQHEGYNLDEGDVRELEDLQDKLSYFPIKRAFFHCAATPEGFDADKKFFDRIWESNGWKYPGYHVIVRLDGTLIWLGEFECEGLSYGNFRNGVKGYNFESIHISYVGGVDYYYKPKDTRTPEQKVALIVIRDMLVLMYPNIKIMAHNQVSNKACPSFKIEDL